MSSEARHLCSTLTDSPGVVSGYVERGSSTGGDDELRRKSLERCGGRSVFFFRLMVHAEESEIKGGLSINRPGAPQMGTVDGVRVATIRMSPSNVEGCCISLQFTMIDVLSISN